jgi:hypothetical protein
MRRTACYYPVVPNREGEIQAVGHLSPHARSRIRIVFEIDRPADVENANLEKQVSEATKRIIKVWGTKFPFLVDLPAYGPEHRVTNNSLAVEHAFLCLRQQGALAVPVAGPISARGPELLEIVRKIARRDGRGIAIRIPFTEFSHTDHGIQSHRCASTGDSGCFTYFGI